MTDAPDSWVLLSRILADVPEARREAEGREIMLRVADGQERIRYLNGDELLRPTPAKPGQPGYTDLAVALDDGTRRADYRYDPLPDLLLRHAISIRFSPR